MAHPGFGRRIRSMRRELQLTQAALAREIGVTKVSVARYEAGRIPRAEVLNRLAKLAGVTVSSLLRGSTGAATGQAGRKTSRFRVSQSQVSHVLPLIEPDWESEPWRQLPAESKASYRKRVRKALAELKRGLEEYRSLLVAQAARIK